MESDKRILEVKNLNVYLTSIDKRQKHLLKNANLTINSGDVLGLVGETGSGKTLLMDAIGGNIKPPLRREGESVLLYYNNQTHELLEKDSMQLHENIWGKGIGFILNNARNRFNPILTIGEQCNDILEANLKLNSEEAYDKIIEMFEMVNMPDPKQNYKSYPHELSGGMMQRVMVAIALTLSTKLLLADEPTMGLDLTIQKQVLELMARLFKEHKCGVILATRDLGIVANYCNKIAVLYEGEIIELAETKEFFANPQHPYSRFLMDITFASPARSEKAQDVTISSNQ